MLSFELDVVGILPAAGGTIDGRGHAFSVETAMRRARGDVFGRNRPILIISPACNGGSAPNPRQQLAQDGRDVPCIVDAPVMDPFQGTAEALASLVQAGFFLIAIRRG